MSIIGPYTALDATRENDGRPVWNIKGPGYDRLIGCVRADTVAMHAKSLTNDLNEAWLAGYRDGHKNGKGSPK